MTPKNTLAVALAQTGPQQWAWKVVYADGREVAVGASLREDVAREEAEFFKRFLERISKG
ncbi:MAG: hypothetical protein ACK4M2_00175 [Brevundimonas sp.]